MPLIPENQITPSARPVQSRRSGLAFPIGSNTLGGLSTVVGNSNDIKIIAIALGSHESENAFQQPEFNMEAALFEMGDQGAQALVHRKLDLVFKQFELENRYRLIKESIVFAQGGDGTLDIDFKFHNLEADEIQTMPTQSYGDR